jgi:hypothetical protein
MEVGATELSTSALSEKTDAHVVLLQRLTSHLVAIYLITYKYEAFHVSQLSDSLAEEKYQHSISFCYRPSFNSF